MESVDIKKFLLRSALVFAAGFLFSLALGVGVLLILEQSDLSYTNLLEAAAASIVKWSYVTALALLALFELERRRD